MLIGEKKEEIDKARGTDIKLLFSVSSRKRNHREEKWESLRRGSLGTLSGSGGDKETVIKTQKAGHHTLRIQVILIPPSTVMCTSKKAGGLLRGTEKATLRPQSLRGWDEEL